MLPDVYLCGTMSGFFMWICVSAWECMRHLCIVLLGVQGVVPVAHVCHNVLCWQQFQTTHCVDVIDHLHAWSCYERHSSGGIGFSRALVMVMVLWCCMHLCPCQTEIYFHLNAEQRWRLVLMLFNGDNGLWGCTDMQQLPRCTLYHVSYI